MRLKISASVTVATLPLSLLTSPAYAPVYPYYGGCASPYYGYPPPPPYNPAATSAGGGKAPAAKALS